MALSLLRWLDVRGGEGRHVGVFFVGLLTIVVGHTLVETARDALFLTYVGGRGLGATYVVNAILAIAGGLLSVRLTAVLGPRHGLLVAQIGSAFAVSVYALLPPSRWVLGSMYGVTALVGTVLVPELWAMAAVPFHATQARRLFPVVALAGVLGATLGSALAAAVLVVAPVKGLLLLGGAFLAGSAVATSFGVAGEPPRRAAACDPSERRPSPFREQPILIGIAVATALGGVTALLVDYAYKLALAGKVPAHELGHTLALVGVVTNALALVAQLGLGRLVVARAGVVGANGFASSLLFLGSAATFLTGGSLLAVVAARVADGATRHSVHRTASELLYLAVPAGPRNRAKPLIEGAVSRGAQALVGGALLLAAMLGRIGVPAVALCAAAAATLWGAATYALWKPYVALLRRSLGAGTLDPGDVQQQLDLASVDVLIEVLASPDPRQVIAAMGALARRGRLGLVPALVLLHDDAEVLETALELFGTTERRDWVRLAEQLVDDRRWRVRRAALRALTLARRLVLDSALPDADEHPWTVGYLAVSRFTTAEEVGAVVEASTDPRETMLGALTAIGDGVATPSESILIEFADGQLHSRDEEVVEAIARAASRLGSPAFLPWMLSRLPHREGRAAVQAALLSLGEVGETAVAQALARGTDRRERVQLPRVLASFGTRTAADVLFQVLATDGDGLVRYRCLRALQPLVERRVLSVAPAEARPLAHRALAEHFRVLGLRAAIADDPPPGDGPANAHRLLVRLLAEKAAQSMARAYLVIGLAFPDEDLRRAHAAATGGDPAGRAAAAELVDALLVPRRGRRGHDELREWLRLAVDELPEDQRAARAGAATTPGAAASELTADPDPVVRALAGDALPPPAHEVSASHG